MRFELRVGGGGGSGLKNAECTKIFPFMESKGGEERGLYFSCTSKSSSLQLVSKTELNFDVHFYFKTETSSGPFQLFSL